MLGGRWGVAMTCNDVEERERKIREEKKNKARRGGVKKKAKKKAYSCLH